MRLDGYWRNGMNLQLDKQSKLSLRVWWNEFGSAELWQDTNDHIKRVILGSALVGSMCLLVWTYVNAPMMFGLLMLGIAVYAVGAAAVVMMDG